MVMKSTTVDYSSVAWLSARTVNYAVNYYANMVHIQTNMFTCAKWLYSIAL